MELIGLLLPALIDLINRKIEDTDVRFWVSVLVCAIVGMVLNYLETMFRFTTPLDGFNSISSSIMIVSGLAQLSYGAFWAKSDLRTDLGLNAKKQ